MKLYYSPLSAYSQKALMAFYEKGITFEKEIVDLTSPEGRAAYKKVYPIGKVPYLDLPEKDWAVPESSIIIEYIDRHCPGGTQLIPDDPDLARQVRMRDRFCDFNINEPMQKIFFDGFRPADKRDPIGVAKAKELLDASLSILNEHMGTNTWSLGDTFSMADCAAAPALAYTSKVYPFEQHKTVMAYLGRLMERPSFAKVVKEAEPFIAKMMAAKG